jgi:hypothetical protein
MPGLYGKTIPPWKRGGYSKMISREEIIGEDALFNSMEKCSKGVKWKGTVAYYRHHWPDEIGKLSKELHDGTYKERRAKFFTVTEPKTREIMSINFRDRIYQRSLNDTAIYPQVAAHFIDDNFACQKDKGTDAAREKLAKYMRAYFQKNGLEGYALKIDIKGYYPNMDHAFAESMLEGYVDSTTFEMAQEILDHLPGEVGYNPGSPIVQIVGITALDKIDHYIKDVLKIDYYVRYMDDFVLLHHDRAYLEMCLIEIRRMLHEQKMEINAKKTTIIPITAPVKFLGFIYRFSSSGKLIILADPEKIKHERKKIVRMVALVRKGELTKYDVDRHFKAYKASVRYGNSHNLLHRLNVWYESLWEGEKPDELSEDREEKNDVA